jgi:2',3'-cyclic-nucleotide 2'-phosphodiesterase (5'-nucleotidase family)
VACVGNATWLRYGPQVLADAADAASYPLLLANLRPVAGVRPTFTLDVAGGRIGFIGITDPFPRFLDGSADYGIEALPIVPLVRDLAAGLRAEGAGLVVLLSHVGYENLWLEHDDRGLARELSGSVDLILGAHSHTLLPDGERVDGVLIAQAGAFGEHLGRIDIDGRNLTALVLPVPEATPQDEAVLAAAAKVEREADAYLDEQVAVLQSPLDPEWIAEMLRARMGGEVGLATQGALIEHDLPAGSLTRRSLWTACHSTANPGLADVRGDRLATMLARGRDPTFQEATTQSLRGRPRGRLAVAGLDGTIEATRIYKVAATDFELESYGGLVEDDWNLEIRYDFPTIVREAVEEHLRR